MVLGAVIGDIVGSIYEFNNHRSKNFPLFGQGCFATDDSIMTLAIAKAVMESAENGYENLGESAIHWMRKIGQLYPNCGYGGRFAQWMYTDSPKPYNSLGNGAAMRVSPVAYAADTIDRCKELSKAVTEVTHNHPEGIKGAEATAVATWAALHKWMKDEIRKLICSSYYHLDFTIDQIRPMYQFNETCQDTVPQAIEAFLESNSFEDAVRTAVSVGGDSDTLAAITCSIAGAFYGVPEAIGKQAYRYLPAELQAVMNDFEKFVGMR